MKNIAEDGQADIGLDYAWLDDVTYLDWRVRTISSRIRRTLNTHSNSTPALPCIARQYVSFVNLALASLIPPPDHKTFLEQAKSIQNGTDPSAPSNPIFPILDDLQLEIKDVIMSFETRFRRMKRAGERAFASASASDASKSDEDLEAGAEPVVSILPVPAGGSDRERADADQAAVADAILGRGEEEVREALLRAGSVNTGNEKTQAHKHEHGHASPSQVADSSKGANHAAPLIAHEEL